MHGMRSPSHMVHALRRKANPDVPRTTPRKHLRASRHTGPGLLVLASPSRVAGTQHQRCTAPHVARRCGGLRNLLGTTPFIIGCSGQDSTLPSCAGNRARALLLVQNSQFRITLNQVHCQALTASPVYAGCTTTPRIAGTRTNPHKPEHTGNCQGPCVVGKNVLFNPQPPANPCVPCPLSAQLSFALLVSCILCGSSLCPSLFQRGPCPQPEGLRPENGRTYTHNTTGVLQNPRPHGRRSDTMAVHLLQPQRKACSLRSVPSPSQHSCKSRPRYSWCACTMVDHSPLCNRKTLPMVNGEERPAFEGRTASFPVQGDAEKSAVD